MLEDGSYEVLVVDVDDLDPADPTAVRHVEVTVLDGPHKGEVVSLSADGLAGDAMDLLAAPGVLTVADGLPRLTLDD